MPNYGSQRCVGCSGEDCVCCEVYLEERASQRYAYEYADEAYYDELDDSRDYEPDDDDCEYEDNGQPSEYEEWQDYYGGDDWDQGQYDEY